MPSEFERTPYEPTELGERVKPVDEEAEEEMAKGRYQWERRSKSQSPQDDRQLVIPKVEVRCLIFTFHVCFLCRLYVPCFCCSWLMRSQRFVFCFVACLCTKP